MRIIKIVGSTYFTKILILLLVICYGYSNTYSQDSTSRRSILIIDDPKEKDSILNRQTIRPGDSAPFIEFTEDQEIRYKSALSLTVPALTRLELDLKIASEEYYLQEEFLKNDPWALAMANMNLPSEFFRPSGQEMLQRQIDIYNSQYVPFVPTLNMYGTQISFETIGMLLGITEDVSPTITFSLDYPDEVEVKIYSVTAVVVRTLFRGYKAGGSHKLTWNFRNDKGQLMPSGDYIAEVKIGEKRYIRKRILIK